MELPGSEPCALKEGTGLGVEHIEPLARFPSGPNNADGGAIGGGSQGSRIAMGQDGTAFGDQTLACIPHAAVDRLVFLLNSGGFGQQGLGKAGRVRFSFRNSQHAPHRPLEVDGSGASRFYLCSNPPQLHHEVRVAIGMDVTGSHGYAVSRGDANSRGAPNLHVPDGRDCAVIAGDFYYGFALWELGLVEQLKAAGLPEDRSDFGQCGLLQEGSQRLTGKGCLRIPQKKLLQGEKLNCFSSSLIFRSC